MKSIEETEPDPTNEEPAKEASVETSMQPAGNNGLEQQSTRKQRRQAMNQIPNVKIRDPTEMVGGDDEEQRQQYTAKEYTMRLKHTKHTTSHNSMLPPQVPSSIKIKDRNSNDSQGFSSIPGLTNSMDMSMTEITPEYQTQIVKTCVKNKVFSIIKFYDREYDSQFSTNPKTLCGFILQNTNLRGDPNWWVEMRRTVVKTHTDLRNNAIKNMQTKFKGTQKLIHNPHPAQSPTSHTHTHTCTS